MKFSYQWLREYLSFELTPEDIEQLLGRHAFEVESKEKKGEDWIIDITILPNRASDAQSHKMMAKEINAIAGFTGTFSAKEAQPEVELEKAEQWVRALPKLKDFAVYVEDEEQCPLYWALKIEGVRVKQSPDWLKKKLAAIGQDSINNLVDISNIVMFEGGQPTHMFDVSSIEENILNVRLARKGEKLELLGGSMVSLEPDNLVIADGKKVLAIAGVKGGARSGISEKTTDIIIEIANFNPASIYKTAAFLHSTTESAKRFSAGFSYQFAPLAAWRMAQLIKEIAGGNIVGLALYEASEVSREKPPIILDGKALERLAGTSISPEVIHHALSCLGFRVEDEGEHVYKVHSPYWRIDCRIPEDIMEEVVRLYGLDTIPPKAPVIVLGEILHNELKQWRSFTRRYFASQGFDEMYNYSFMPEPKERKERCIKLLNPISEDTSFLRDNLIDGLITNAIQNQGLFAEMKLFEMGNVYWCEHNIAKEEEHIAGLIFGKKKVDFRDMRGYVEGFLEAAGFDEDDYTLEPLSKQGQTSYLALIIQGKECGSIKVPPLLEKLKLKGQVVAFELRSPVFYRAIANEREFQTPPKFPAVIRDVALMLPKDIKGDSVEQVVYEVGRELIEDVDLFDVHEEGTSKERGLAFHVVYRSSQKTLTDEEVNKVHQRIEKELKERLHAKIR